MSFYTFGKCAHNDRIGAEIIAKFMEFMPDTGRKLPRDKLRELRAMVRCRVLVI